MRRALSILMAGLLLAIDNSASADEQAAKFFEEQIHPILAKRCYECHGAEKQESGLRLDSREAVLQGVDSETPAAVAGDPAKSLLIRAVRHDGDLKMPPDEKIPDAEVALLTRWVEQGLQWGTKTSAPLRTPEAFAGQVRKEHWSLQPVRRPALPQVTKADWVATPIDQFVLAKLEAAGMGPSASADRRTLIRRLSFDLWGLAPSLEEVEAFVQDQSPDAYGRLVERWLASPRYGERWGRHWLDLARYADTKGYAFTNDRRYPYAYTYRDYVIGALNSDKPYNEFILEQLAADQLPIGDDKTRLAAMGFLTTGRKFNNRQDDLDDQIDVVSRGLLGLTVSCARCHDHKYDPVPTEDYYSLYGVFASSQEPDDLPLIGEPKQGQEYAEFEKGLAERKKALEDYRAQQYVEVIKQSREKAGAYLARLATEKPDMARDRLSFMSLDKNDLRFRLLERWRAYIKLRSKVEDPVFGPWHELVAVNESEFSEKSRPILEKWQSLPGGTEPNQLNPILKAKLAAEPPATREDLGKRYGEVFLAAFEKWSAAGGNQEAFGKLAAEDRQLAEVIAGKDSPTDIAPADLSGYLNRADRNQFRELEKKIQAFQASSPAAPPRAMILKEDERPHDPRVFLRGNAGRPGKPVARQFLLVVAGPERRPFQQKSGRLELAQSIADDGNPLTRRVIANRIWMHHFGQSLVRTPSDFGTRCEPPLQVELLEYMAARLLENQWSLKSLHREILLSSTYQQASSFRPDASAKDPENRLLWRMNRRRLEFEPLRDSLLAASDRLDLAMGGRPVDLLKTPFALRRSVYGYIDRQDLPNLFRVFDFASPDQSQPDRPRTTVPQQALFMMNSPFVIEQARNLASREEVQKAADDQSRVIILYRRIFQRDPTSDELNAAVEFVSGSSGESKSTMSHWEQLAQLLLLTNEFAYID